MPVINADLSLKQAVDPRARGTEAFGYVTSLTIGGVQLSADVTGTKNPEATPRAVVGVLTSFRWNTEPAGAIQMTFGVSTSNQLAVRSGMLKGGDRSVAFGFVAYAYDFVGSQMYTQIHTEDKTLTGKLTAEVDIDDRPVAMLGIPPMYAMSIQIAPAAAGQPIVVAFAPSETLVKTWGSTV